MAGNLELNAQLIAQPACGDGSFPAGITNIPLSLLPCSKPYAVVTGDQWMNVASPSSYAALGSIGSGGSVTHATTLMLRTTTPLMVQLSLNNNGTGTTTASFQVSGLLVLEFPTSYECVGVGVQGAGTVEYFAAGAS